MHRCERMITPSASFKWNFIFKSFYCRISVVIYNWLCTFLCQVHLSTISKFWTFSGYFCMFFMFFRNFLYILWVLKTNNEILISKTYPLYLKKRYLALFKYLKIWKIWILRQNSECWAHFLNTNSIFIVATVCRIFFNYFLWKYFIVLEILQIDTPGIGFHEVATLEVKITTKGATFILSGTINSS